MKMVLAVLSYNILCIVKTKICDGFLLAHVCFSSHLYPPRIKVNIHNGTGRLAKTDSESTQHFLPNFMFLFTPQNLLVIGDKMYKKKVYQVF